MRLHLVRHGETHANVARQLDTAVPGLDLTEAGQDQARALAERLRGEDLGAIYVSDLVRTHQTAAPLASALGLDLVVLPGLREIQAGDYEMSTDWKPFIEAVRLWQHDPEHAIPGGDSGIGFMARYEAAIRRIASDGHAAAVAVSHGAAIRVWTAGALQLAPDWFETRGVGNTLVVTMDGSPDDGWRLVSWGDEIVDA